MKADIVWFRLNALSIGKQRDVYNMYTITVQCSLVNIGIE